MGRKALGTLVHTSVSRSAINSFDYSATRSVSLTTIFQRPDGNCFRRDNIDFCIKHEHDSSEARVHTKNLSTIQKIKSTPRVVLRFVKFVPHPFSMHWVRNTFVMLIGLVPHALGLPYLENFPEYHSLAGLSPDEVRVVARSFSRTPGAQPLPPPIDDTSAKLVNDADHPFMHLRPGDIRGPCPGLNTLASHGYIDRKGVASPAEIITAAQEGFNMGHDVASYVTYSAFVVDGNHLTNMMSIGKDTTVESVHITGIDTHGNFEGDVSITRDDKFFGDSIKFNKTLFDQLAYAADQVGNGMITLDSLAMHKIQRVSDSIARNPEFMFDPMRYISTYTELTLPITLFVNNQTANTTLNCTVDDARSFFKDHKFPEGFHRRDGPYGFNQLKGLFGKVSKMVGLRPGHNKGRGKYVENKNLAGDRCSAYHHQVALLTKLYPKPISELKTAIKANLVTLYNTVQDSSCKQLFPYGE